jgi:hypothetical protein
VFLELAYAAGLITKCCVFEDLSLCAQRLYKCEEGGKEVVAIKKRTEKKRKIKDKEITSYMSL